MGKLKKQQPTSNTRRRPGASQRHSPGSYPAPLRPSRPNSRIRTTPPTNRIPSPRIPNYSPVSDTASSEVAGPPPLEIAPSRYDAYRGRNRSSASHSCNELPSDTTSSLLLSDEGTESSLRRVTNVDLYRILRNQEYVNPDEFIDVIRKLTNGISRYTIDFSERFKMLMVLWKGIPVWFTCVDHVPFVFALSEKFLSDELIIKNKGKCKTIPWISIPSNGCTWTTLQQKLVDRFKVDDHVRAVLAACMLSFGFRGKFTCALETLFPTSLRRFEPAIEFDVPIDVDILTCMADPYLTKGNKLFFHCAGKCAVVKHLRDDGIYHLESITPPPEKKWRRFKEASHRLMPYFYGFGFGEIINDPRNGYQRTTELKVLMERLEAIGKGEGNVYNILKMVRLASPRKELDLTEAANMISELEGGILPKPLKKKPKSLRGVMARMTRSARQITGDVILVGKDGLYRSSRFDGTVIEGSIEANWGLIKMGFKASHTIEKKMDPRITKVSEVAAYILGKKYVPLDNCDGDVTMVPDMNDMWNDEIAVANTLAALICRRFGVFKGFSSSASSPKYFDSPPRYLDSLFPGNLVCSMEADIYLPVHHVFVDPPQQFQMMRCGFMLLLLLFSVCTLTASLLDYLVLPIKCFVAYVVTLFCGAWNLDKLEEWLYRGCLEHISPWLRPRERLRVGRDDRKYDLLIHNNPFVFAEQDGRVRVFGHHCSYSFANLVL